MTLDLRLNPASFRRQINTSTDVRTGRQVDVGYWLYDVVTRIQPISDVKLTSDACWGRVFLKTPAAEGSFDRPAVGVFSM